MFKRNKENQPAKRLVKQQTVDGSPTSKKMNTKRVTAILGVLLIVSSVGLYTWYEFLGGRQYLLYEDIVVAKDSIKKGQVVEAADLTFMKVEKTQLANGVILNPNDVIGKQANHFIPQFAQLDTSYLSENGLVLKEGQFIAQIPVEWTLSIPDTLRRGDDIIMYSALFDSELLKNLNAKTTATSNSKDKNSTASTGGTAATTSSGLEELLQTKVAFVKDGANREVVTVSNGDRIDGSAAIGSVEIITTPDEFKEIEGKINSGHKLIFMYTDENGEDRSIIQQKQVEEDTGM